MMGRRSGDVTWEQFMRRMTAIDTYNALCRLLDGMPGIDAAMRETVRLKFLGNIRNSAIPQVWKLPPGLVKEGLNVITQKWGSEGRDFAERRRPWHTLGFFARARRKVVGLFKRGAAKGERR